jgi:hypothetical protein
MPAPTPLSWYVEQNRTIAAECEVCRKRWPVDLRAILKAKGPDFTLANKRPPCPAEDCPGRVRFRDCSTHWPRDLDTIEVGTVAYWQYAEGERVRLTALGWRMEGGRWVKG